MSAGGSQEPVIIIGAGMGGLAAALRLAVAGVSVEVLEAGDAPGGKLRRVEAGGRAFDGGPTVLTMKWVFDELLRDLGTSLDDELVLEKAKLIARHYWSSGDCLDLDADPEQSAEAVAAFAGEREAAGFRRFRTDSARVYSLLKDTFINATRPNPLSLSRRIGVTRPGALLALKPFSTLWPVLGDYFAAPRLRQLFARYATYCGSSPFLAPATLMLVAHVEQEGVWVPQQGMHAVAEVFARLAVRFGARIRYGCRVEQITIDPARKQVTGVRLQDGEAIPAGRIIFNGDAAALPRLLTNARDRRGARSQQRSQSALVMCCPARPAGVPLAHHTVFFSDDYEAEFRAVFERRAAPDDPTVYVCAQDRAADGSFREGHAIGDRERIYCLMNMPADGDRHSYSRRELDQCLTSMDRRLAANGLTLERDRKAELLVAPDTYARLFPATGGALYGRASHGWMASFARPGARGPVGGLYLAGGSVHPGPGVPMAALSGRIAADCLIADQASTGRFRRGAIVGGTRTPQATADNLP
ncbi:phytoene desaturase [Rhodobacterales bacterium]|nr:phytoene desaturase [Rhodobacterales bacterium]